MHRSNTPGSTSDATNSGARVVSRCSACADNSRTSLQYPNNKITVGCSEFVFEKVVTRHECCYKMRSYSHVPVVYFDFDQMFNQIESVFFKLSHKHTATVQKQENNERV